MEWIATHLSYILVASLGVFLNIMDSVTTEIGLNRLPHKIRAEEGNPIGRWGLRKNPILFHVVKQVLVLGIVSYYVIDKFVFGLVFIAIVFGMVVLNNVVAVVMRLVTGKRRYSPLFMLTNLIHAPKSTAYLLIVIILTIVATLLARMVKF